MVIITLYEKKFNPDTNIFDWEQGNVLLSDMPRLPCWLRQKNQASNKKRWIPRNISTQPPPLQELWQTAYSTAWLYATPQASWRGDHRSSIGWSRNRLPGGWIHHANLAKTTPTKCTADRKWSTCYLVEDPWETFPYIIPTLFALWTEKQGIWLVDNSHSNFAWCKTWSTHPFCILSLNSSWYSFSYKTREEYAHE